MNIKINRQNNTITINDVLSLPIDNKIVVEFEKETLNSDTMQLSGGLDMWILTRNGEEEQTTVKYLKGER